MRTRLSVLNIVSLASGIALSLASFEPLVPAAMAQNTLPTQACSAPTSALRSLPGLTSVTVYEMTGGYNNATFSINDGRLLADINEGPGNADVSSNAAEYYDIFFSDEHGTANPNGAYISVDAFRNNTLQDGATGNNIDSLMLHFADGRDMYASMIAHTELGTGLGSSYQQARGFAENILGAPDGAPTYLGDQYSSLTLGFCDVFTATPQCSVKVEYTTTGVNNARETSCGYNTGSVAGACPQPSTPGYTLVDIECLQNGGVGNCLSKICLWEKPSTQNFDYTLTQQGLSGATCPSQLPNNVNCANNPPAGYALNSRYCSKSDPINGGCISEVCLWQKPNTASTTTALRFSHDGNHISNVTTAIQTGQAHCDTIVPAAGYTLNTRVGIASFSSGAYSDLCLWQKTAQCTAPASQCSDGIDNDGDGIIDMQDPGCSSPQDNDETDALACPAGQRLEYTMTTTSTAFWNSNGALSGSGPVSCSNPGAGWTMVDSECLISGGPCYAQSCLWSRPASQNLNYLLTHAGANYYQSVSCATQPPAGYTLKAQGCYAKNGVAPSYCFSDSCLWEKTGGSTTANLLLSHAGGNAGDAVDCRNAQPAAGYAINSRIGVLSTGSCETGNCGNIFSDLCLWQKTTQCAAPAAQCSDGIDNDGDWIIDMQDPGCSSPQDNDEFNGSACAANTTQSTINVSCTGGQNGLWHDLCNPAHNFTVATPVATPLTLSYTAAAGHCTAIKIRVLVDGQERVLSPFVGFIGDPQGRPRSVNLSLGNVTAGNHTISVIGDIAGGPDCGGGRAGLASWGGNVIVTAGVNQCQTTPQCRDGIDNDGDGATDMNDFSCSNADDNDETNPKSQCQDGLDNDNDGKVDFPQDPGCSSKQDNDESNVMTPALPACSDGIDNDGDGKTDFFDACCYPNNVFNPALYNPNDTDESNAASLCRWTRVNSQWVRSCM